MLMPSLLQRLILLLSVLLLLVTSVKAENTVSQREVQNCNSSASIPNLLEVDDRISAFGPILDDVQLLTRSDGVKYLVFTVKNNNEKFVPQYWNLRYQVIWQDECGRSIPSMTKLVDGFLLNPNDVLTLQSVASNPKASRARLYIYFE